MHDWLKIAEDLAARTEAGFPECIRSDPEWKRDPFGCVLNVSESPLTDEIKEAYRRCDGSDADILNAITRDNRHRILTKHLIVETRSVPESLFRSVVWAGATTRNPSFNRHYIWPCAMTHGRRRVLGTLLDMANDAAPDLLEGIKFATYWCTMPLSEMHWLGTESDFEYCDRTDEPIEDILARHRDLFPGGDG